MHTVTVRDVAAWLAALSEDRYPEDGLLAGDEGMAVRGAVWCWMANGAVRARARAIGANVVVTHESVWFETRNRDAGCPPPEEWAVNVEARRFQRETGTAFIRCHRGLDAHCVPEAFEKVVGLPTPVVREGHKGYCFTRIYDLGPVTFGSLTEQLKCRAGLRMVRTSACDAGRVVRRAGLGWGGVGLSTNIQYLELLRRHGAEVVIGGEVDEYAVEYYRDSAMEWIEIGHYASEFPGVREGAREMAAAFPGVRVECFEDGARIEFR